MRLERAAVLERFGRLAGLPSREDLRHPYLCGDAAAQIEGMIREDAPESAMEVLCAAAAALAFYRLTLLESTSGPDRFTAGELQVQKNAQAFQRAQQIWNEYQKAAAPYLLDREFVFERVG